MSFFRIGAYVLACLLGVISIAHAEAAEEPERNAEPSSGAMSVFSPCSTNRMYVKGVHMHAQFTNPKDPCDPGAALPQGNEDWVIINEFIRMVDNVPSGGTINGTFSKIEIDAVAQALKRAKDRGVTIRLSINGNMINSTDPAITSSTFGIKNAFTSTERVFCGVAGGNNYSCNSSVDGGPDQTNAFAHTKMFTFSSTTPPDDPESEISDVIWISSANFSFGSGLGTTNNAVQWYGAPTAYGEMVTHLNRMYLESPKTNDYTLAYYTASGVLDAWGSPRTTDFVYKQLNDIASGPDCHIRVMQNTFKWRSQLADRLAYKATHNGGCDIEVMVSKAYGDPNCTAHIGPVILQTLTNAGIPVYVHHTIHDKVLLLQGTISGTPNSSRVYTGSHNWHNSSLYDNDELFVRIPDDSITTLYQNFLSHYNSNRNDGKAFLVTSLC